MFSRYPRDPSRPRGGVEAVTLVLARALARRQDVELHVVTLEADRTHDAVQCDGPIRVHRLAGSRWPQILDIHFGPGRKRLWRCLARLRPDVLHAHETHGLRLTGLPSARVFTCHGFDEENLRVDRTLGWSGRLRAWLWGRVTRCGLAAQSEIIAINPYVRSRIAPLTRAIIHDIDNPVDARFFEISRDGPTVAQTSTSPPRVLCVGWLNERKNPLGAVAGFAAAARRGADGTLVFAGSAKQAVYLGRVRSAARQAGLLGQVEFLGHVDRDRLAAELARAAVLLLPSRQENAPMAVAEAMAAAVPVVASNRCGMPFMVDDGRSGFLVDPEDPEQIGDRLARLLGDPRLREQMGRHGRQIALRRFHPDRVADRTLEVYRQAVSRARNGG